MKKITSLAALLLLFTGVFSQDKILFLTGKEITNVKIDTITGDFIRYFNQKGKDKFKAPNEVFSVTYDGKKETVLYKKNLLIGNELSVPEVRNYLKGAQHAQKSYKGYVPVGVAFVSGFLGGNLGNLFFAPLPPLTTILVLGSFSPNTKAENPSLLDNEDYVYGYNSKAKSKKIQKMAASALVGIIFGYAAQQEGWVDLFKNPNAK